MYLINYLVNEVFVFGEVTFWVVIELRPKQYATKHFRVMVALSDLYFNPLEDLVYDYSIATLIFFC